MRKTGQLLKEAREKQGVSLNAVSAATKISVKVLEAIEAGDSSELPPKTFVRGFVQTYAMFLKLDVKTVMDVFQEEVGTTRYAPTYDKKEGEPPVAPTGAPAPAQPAKAAKVKVPGETAALPDKPGLTKWLMAGLALFLFIAIYFVSQTVQKYKRESEVSQLPDGVTDGAIASATPNPGATPEPETDEPAATPSTSPGATAEPGATPAASPEAGASPAPASP
ncbi:MAG TPA: helix-turn-helix domain-containing protein, partial [Bdellovibrionales bacterium]|nr:helix-turn-helix domain-containing protein [Bdellovibrionales bacterium]